MRDGRLAQRILSLVVRGDRAAAMVGDLVEEATARGPLWFWTAIARTTLAFFWLSVSTAVRRLTNPSSTLLDTGVQMTAATTQTRSVFATLWRHKWLIVVPTVLVTATTGVVAHFIPVRYRAEATIQLVPQILPLGDLLASSSSQAIRVEMAGVQIQSRSRLERLIFEHKLYDRERSFMKMNDVIERMRGDIGIQLVSQAATGTRAVKVTFASPDALTAQQVTEALGVALMSVLIEDNGYLTKSTVAFIDAQAARVRKRLVAFEAEVERSRTARGGQTSRAEMLELQTLEEMYAALLTKREAATIALEADRGQIGEQPRFIEAARVPERPITPDRVQINAAGVFGGLAIGLILVARKSHASAS